MEIVPDEPAVPPDYVYVRRGDDGRLLATVGSTTVRFSDDDSAKGLAESIAMFFSRATATGG
jgi:hypothetical protein